MPRLLDAETVRTRLADVAPLNEAVDVAAQIDDSSWGLAVQGVGDCLLQLEDGGATLTASIDIGTPVAARGDRVRGAALTFNALWRETRGTRIVQAGESGELTLVRPFTADAVCADDFGHALVEFGHVATWWQTYVAHEGRDEPEAGAVAGMRV